MSREYSLPGMDDWKLATPPEYERGEPRDEDEEGEPCSQCNATYVPRSACPGCGAVVCEACAEKPYEFCCEESDDE
jgi:hypothetical protein